MGYMTISRKTDSQLRLLREPTFLSKAVFIGFLVGISGVLVFGSETILFKVLIGIVAIVLSCFMVDNYELCEMNKESSDVRLTRLHLCQYFLENFLPSRPFVTCKLADIGDVRVEDHSPSNSEKMYRVVLVLKAGIPLGVTEIYTNDERSEHEKVAEVITSFLGIKHGSGTAADDMHDDANISSSEDGDKSAEEEDDFEEITKAEIEKLQEEQQMNPAGGDLSHGPAACEMEFTQETYSTGAQNQEGQKSLD